MNNIGICGAGLIGVSWAVGFASNGFKVYIYDNNSEVLNNFFQTVFQLVQDLNVFKEVDFDYIKGNIKICYNIKDICYKSVLIQESIKESLVDKQNLFCQLENFSSPETILASSSSYILPSQIAKNVKRKERCIVAHPALPPHIIPFVEICPSSDTSIAILEKSKSIYQKCNYIPIILKKEIEGFVLNRLQGALLNEAVRLHEGGYATIEDIDLSLKQALGLRWAFLGPFEIMDLNAPDGIADSFFRYREGIKRLAQQQNSVPEYTDKYINLLEDEHRKRLKFGDREEKIKKRNHLVSLLRKLKQEQGE